MQNSALWRFPASCRVTHTSPQSHEVGAADQGTLPPYPATMSARRRPKPSSYTFNLGPYHLKVKSPRRRTGRKRSVSGFPTRDFEKKRIVTEWAYHINRLVTMKLYQEKHVIAHIACTWNSHMFFFCFYFYIKYQKIKCNNRLKRHQSSTLKAILLSRQVEFHVEQVHATAQHSRNDTMIIGKSTTEHTASQEPSQKIVAWYSSQGFANVTTIDVISKITFDPARTFRLLQCLHS